MLALNTELTNNVFLRNAQITANRNTIISLNLLFSSVLLLHSTIYVLYSVIQLKHVIFHRAIGNITCMHAHLNPLTCNFRIKSTHYTRLNMINVHIYLHSMLLSNICNLYY